jgi:HEPN domain-containing protein
MTHDLYYGVSEQSKAAKHRRDDAQVLFDGQRWRGAMYMAGYSIECLLKFKLMQRFRCRQLNELEQELQRRGVLAAAGTVFTHQLRTLMLLAGALDRLRQNQAAWRQFNVANGWLPAWRYSADLASREDAEGFLAAVDAIRNWIEANV